MPALKRGRGRPRLPGKRVSTDVGLYESQIKDIHELVGKRGLSAFVRDAVDRHLEAGGKMKHRADPEDGPIVEPHGPTTNGSGRWVARFHAGMSDEDCVTAMAAHLIDCTGVAVTITRQRDYVLTVGRSLEEHRRREALGLQPREWEHLHIVDAQGDLHG